MRLDPNNISKNPGRCQLARIMLNSFWGKFGQPNFMTYSATIITTFTVCTSSMKKCWKWCTTISPNAAQCKPTSTSSSLASRPAMHASILYRALKTLEQQQTKYFDTDSIIYSWKPGQPELPLGNYLSKFTSELDAGDHIVEFAAAGPQNYGYKTHKGKIECKVRRFSLNRRGQEQLNFDILRDNVQAELQRLQTEAHQIPVWNPTRS